MDPYIEAAKETVQLLAEEAQSKIKELQTTDNFLRFSIVAFRDHPEETNEFVTLVQDFTSAADTNIFLEKLTAKGGGDVPEAVVDGLYAAAYNISWNANTEKMLYLIADAPAHGRKYHKLVDNYPDGCPCGKNEEEVLTFLRKMNVQMSVIMIKRAIKLMVELFAEHINIEAIDVSEQNEGKSLFKKMISKPKKLEVNMSDVPGINFASEVEVQVLGKRAVNEVLMFGGNLKKEQKSSYYDRLDMYSGSQNAMINKINTRVQGALKKECVKRKMRNNNY